MAISQVGTSPAVVYTTTNGTNTPTLAWGTGQNRTAGHLLVLVVTASAATSVTAPSTPAGWSSGVTSGNTASTPHAWTGIFYKTAAGSDATPSISVTTSGTTRCGFSLFELSNVNTVTGPLDTTGTYASGSGSSTISSMTVTSGANVTVAAEFAIAAFARNQASAATATWTPGSNWVNFAFDGVTSAANHLICDTYTAPATGATLSDAGTVTSAATSYGAGVVAVFLGYSGFSGPPLSSIGGPQGVRVTAVRPGLATASLIPLPAAAPGPSTGVPFPPLNQPTRARIPQVAPRGRAATNGATPVHNPTQGPVFRLPVQAVRARQPLPPRGTSYTRTGPAPVHAGPPFTLPSQPARTRIPQTAPRGRVSGNPGAAVVHSGPVTYPLPGPVTARRPLPPRGRVYGNAGAPVRNPSSGPPAPPLTSPVQARRPLFLLGRAESRPGAPVRNPSQGPVFRLPAQPARYRIVLPPRGRVYGNPGAPVSNPQPPVIGKVPALTRPVQARLPRTLTGRIIATPVTETIAVVYGKQVLSAPAGVLVYLLAGGRVQASVRTSPVRNPQTVPAPLYPLTQPVRAHRPLPAPGRAATMASLPVPVNPATPAVFPPLTQPVRSRISPPPRGHVHSRLGAPVSNPVTGTGPPFRPQGVVQARRPLPAPGRAATMAVLPVPSNPVTGIGEPFPPLTQPVRARQPLPPRGRAYASVRGIIANPPPPVPVLSPPLRQPVKARLPYPVLPGRAATMGVLPVPSNPPTPTSGPPFPPWPGPAGLRVIFCRTGTGSGSPGAPVSVPGAQATFYPLHKALHAQPAVFLKGRAISNGATPVRNPTRGPVFRQATSPARYRIILPPRGRVYGNPGAPINNPIEAPPPAGTLYLTPGTIIQGRPYAATTITTPAGVLTVTSATTGILAISPAAEGFAPSQAGPPPDSDLPPPDSVVVPAYVQR